MISIKFGAHTHTYTHKMATDPSPEVSLHRNFFVGKILSRSRFLKLQSYFKLLTETPSHFSGETLSVYLTLTNVFMHAAEQKISTRRSLYPKMFSLQDKISGEQVLQQDLLNSCQMQGERTVETRTFHRKSGATYLDGR